MLKLISFKSNTIAEKSEIVPLNKEKNLNSETITENKTDEVVIANKENKVSENIVLPREKKENVLYKVVKSFAHAQKTYVTAKEGLFGTVGAISAGLTTVAGVMSLDWYITRLAGHGDKSQSLWKTPIKTVGNAFLSVGKKLCRVWNKPIKEIVKYPFTGFPKDISNYINNSKGISKHGKGLAIGLGIAATLLSAGCTLVKINRARADVDHGFKIGHNK